MEDSPSAKRFSMKKFFRYFFYSVILLFAFIGFGLTSAYFAVKLHITNDPGGVDKNDRIYQALADRDKNSAFNDSTYFAGLDNRRALDYYKIMVISKFYPVNANFLLDGLTNNKDAALASKMIAAVEMKLQDNSEYQTLIKKGEEIFNTKVKKQDTLANCFVWMNVPEWTVLKESIINDKKSIDSAARVSGVESRLVVCCLIGEQIRMFNSKREIYKSYIAPMKVLSVESKFSLGVTGIKDFTAMEIERNLKNKKSPYYLGEKYEHLLDFKTDDIEKERYDRLVDYKNHYYSYLYAALYVHQVKKQWERAKYDISNRPEILTTLFNVGFASSVPKPNPEVGGSHIEIGGKIYTFGAVAFDFYYSGELAKEFPYEKQKFSI
mgnify:CR=1 FL=1